MAFPYPKKSKETPLMRQYNQIKSKYPGALLLFRVGDFYETFGEDAILSSQILNIVLTKRANGSASSIELAGFPHHSLDTYIPKLIKAGHRVAICDQLEDPSQAKGIVKRGVTELITPGLSYHDNILEKRNNNFLASIHIDKDIIGISFLDLSTGEFLTTQGNKQYIEKLLQGFNPSEVIFNKKYKKEIQEIIKDQFHNNHLEEWIYQLDFAYEKLNNQFKTKSLKGFGVENIKAGIIASGAILRYLEETEHNQIKHINSISRIEQDKYVWLDQFTIRNLELIYPQQENGVPLISVIDKTITPMGARLLKKWILMPLKSKLEINQRLNIVEKFVEDPPIRQNILQHLKQLSDLERLSAKVSAQRMNPREMVALKKSLFNTTPIKKYLQDDKILKETSEQINDLKYIHDKIENTLEENPPINISQGQIIKIGVNDELDKVRKISSESKLYLEKLKQREIKKTGISSLKISYNKVFGYYIEVTNTHKDKVPSNWIRKQTLTNAERYITEELKEYEETILNAQDKISLLEQKLYQELVINVGEFVEQIQSNARILAKIDCFIALSQLATQFKYSKPIISEDEIIKIKKGRHPVIEQQLPIDKKYVPNDIYLDTEKQQIIIITGPNMAGKSALLRQIALITLLAQIGSFVPAKSAEIGIVDKIFTRVGASDNIAKGESTFMVEMTETASILNNLSKSSLIIMDEIGRGTSTYDGIAIAQSIVEFLHNNNLRPKTLFATHYHELNQLSDSLKRVKNFNVEVREVDNKVIFMHKLKEGGSKHSFGINVAQMAGIPQSIVSRANQVMNHLADSHSKSNDELKSIAPPSQYQLTLFQENPKHKKIEEKLKNISINETSPVEALLKLNELKKLNEEALD